MSIDKSVSETDIIAGISSNKKKESAKGELYDDLGEYFRSMDEDFIGVNKVLYHRALVYHVHYVMQYKTNTIPIKMIKKYSFWRFYW